MNRILVVEDDDSVRENILDLLSIEGYQPVPARDGEEAVRLAWESKPDLIICDIALPYLDGYGVLSKLSRDPQTSTIPFIFLTALSSQEEIRKGMGLGVDDYITKPFELHELLKAVEIRLTKKRALTDKVLQTHSERAALLNHKIPFEVLGMINQIIKHSELLVEKSKLLGNCDVQSLAGEIKSVSGQLLNMANNYLYLTNLEEVMRDTNRIIQHRKTLTSDAHTLINEITQAVANQAGRQKDVSLDLSAADLFITNDHLLKIIEEILAIIFHACSEGQPIRIQGMSLESRGFYQVQFEFTCQAKEGTWPDSPMELGIINEEIKFPADEDLGLLIVRQLLDLYGCEISISPLTYGTQRISLTLPLADEQRQLV